MKKFWICNICTSSSSVTVSEKLSKSRMKQIVIGDMKILVPTDNVQNEDIVIEMDTYILVPKRDLIFI